MSQEGSETIQVKEEPVCIQLEAVESESGAGAQAGHLEREVKQEPKWESETVAKPRLYTYHKAEEHETKAGAHVGHTECEVKGKPEFASEDGECGMREMMVTTLYTGHTVKEELVVGPEEVHRPELVLAYPASARPEEKSDVASRACSVVLEGMHVDLKRRTCIVGLQVYKFRLSRNTQQDIHTSIESNTSKNELSGCLQRDYRRKQQKTKADMLNKKYSKEDLEKALEDIKNGVLTIYRASQVYKIPNQTLHDKINKKYKTKENAGAPTVLTSQEEQLVVQWVLHMAEIGFPVTKDQLLQSVPKLLLELKRPNPFKNGVPGRNWYEAFLKRHPIITKRVCQALTTVCVNADEEIIKGWFGRVRKYFEENNHLDVLGDPSRIFNCDEFAFFFNPKGQPVLARKGVKNVHCQSGNDDRANLTLSLGASAEGKLMPVLTLFPYKRLPQNILLKYPKDWISGRTDSGWMTCETFYEYVANQFEPYLTRENIKRPVVLFLDGHVSHLSLPLCEFCKQKEIILIALLPNATHSLQPMDVAVFHSLKNAWSKEVYTWRMENNDSRLKQEDFAPVLEKAIRKTLRPEIIQNGFRKSGLFPFDENAVDYKKLPKSSAMSSSQHMEFIKRFEMNLDPHKLNAFRECSGDWTGNVKDDSLYYFWKQLSQACTSEAPSSLTLGNSTLEANDFTVADVDLDWVNDDTIVESALLNEVT